MKVGIYDAHFFAFHGYYEEERKFGNNFILNLEVEFSAHLFQNENLYLTINYDDLFQICKQEMKSKRLLLETVCIDILSQIKKKYPEILSAKIRIDKSCPQIGGKLYSTFVQMDLNDLHYS